MNTIGKEYSSSRNHINVQQNDQVKPTSDKQALGNSPSHHALDTFTKNLDEKRETEDMTQTNVDAIHCSVIGNSLFQTALFNGYQSILPQPQKVEKKIKHSQVEIEKLSSQLENEKSQSHLIKVELQIEREKLNKIQAEHKKIIKRVQQTCQNKINYIENKLKLNMQKLQDEIKANQTLQEEKQAVTSDLKLIKEKTTLRIIEVLANMTIDGQPIQFNQQNSKLIEGVNLIQSKLNQIRTLHYNQNQRLSKDIKKLTKVVKQVDITKFIYPDYYSEILFNLSIQSLRRDRLQTILPNSQVYGSLIEFLSYIDSTVKEILQGWKKQVDGDKKVIIKLQDEKVMLINEKQELITKVKEIQLRQIQMKEQKQQKITRLTSEKQSLEITMTKSIAELKKKLRIQEEQSERKKTQLNQQAQKRSNQYKLIIQNLKDTRAELATENHKQKQNIKIMQKKITQLQSENTNLNTKFEQIQQQYINYKKTTKLQHQQLSKNYANLQTQYNNLQKQRNSLLNKTKIDSDTQRSYWLEITELKKQLTSAKRQLSCTQNDRSQWVEKARQQSEEIQILSQKPQYVRCFLQYFNGMILNYKNQQKVQWFVQNLQKGCNKKIKSTQLLYRYDKQNKTTFHHYVDYKPNLVLMVKMQNNIIAGYSEPALQPGNVDIDYKFGMMFSFFNNKVFVTKKQPSSKLNQTKPRPLTYDEYYLIIGNSDIRIQQGNDELYSGYAANNSCFYEEGNEKMTVMDMGFPPSRETKLLEYQVFQIQFEQ